MPKHVRVALFVLTALSWAVLILAATPLGDGFDPDFESLARTLAITGTIATLVTRTMPAADELVRVGKALGRADAQREAAAGNVTPLRPDLRVVGQRSTE
jgi:hypothetical protein